MNGNEWPLVFFTLFTQISAGMIMTMFALSVIFRQHEMVVNIEFRRNVVLIALVFMGLALLLSFMHLARPLHSVFSLHGLASSWLSREILLASAFFGLLLAIIILMKAGAPGLKAGATDALLHNGLVGIAVIISILLIYSMIRIYMLPTVPAWNSIATPISFFNTALLLGPAALLIAMVHFLPQPMMLPETKNIITTLLVLILAGILIHLTISLFLIPKEIPPAVAVIPEKVGAYWTIAQWFFLFVGLSFMIAWYVLLMTDSNHLKTSMLYLGGLALLLAEVSARYQFYASYYRIGV